uniref:Uncharacterized protein n=1 Tax=Siphoviridae sp. ctcx61 TaxID=2825575 RepID=A0A8S5TWN0_9CAUD|nr:MAG TPA: hypothetical protein [Siphoviridae sp. ctcx61]
MSKKSVTLNFDMNNENDILVYFYLVKLVTNQVNVSSEIKEMILDYINKDDNLKTLVYEKLGNSVLQNNN